MKITSILAREILDSRGYPTVEATVITDKDTFGRSSVPSGASTGTHEAVELRDNDPDRFLGKGVLQAVAHITSRIAPALTGKSVDNQHEIDEIMISLDGTDNKSKLGANAILAVSEACLKAAAATANTPLYKYVLEQFSVTHDVTMPQPTFNVINGGRHGNGKLEFQEFHILPRTNQTFAEMLRMGDEVYLHLAKLMKSDGIYQGIGDEGGYTGDFDSNTQAIDYLIKAIQAAGYKKFEDIAVGLDVASAEFYNDNTYHIAEYDKPLSATKMIDLLVKLNSTYHFAYLEDGLDQDDWKHWGKLTQAFQEHPVPIVGDDFLTTNPKRVRQAIAKKACNAVLVKPNQIGTVTEVLDVIKQAKAADWSIVLSHRSGETNDSFVADFAVGVGADIVKFGAPARGERVSKYNRLMEIESESVHV